MSAGAVAFPDVSELYSNSLAQRGYWVPSAPWYVYIILTNDTFFVGVAQDVEYVLAQHQAGKVPATQSIPGKKYFRLVKYWKFLDEFAAFRSCDSLKDWLKQEPKEIQNILKMSRSVLVFNLKSKNHY